MTTNQYYLCAYGNSTRVSNRVSSPRLAAAYCYGVVDRVTVVSIGGRSWKYLPQKEKDRILAELKAQHKTNTGNDL